MAPRLEDVALVAGEILWEAGTLGARVYFPRSGMLSMIGRMADGAAAEVGTVGDEGFAGLGVLLGGGAESTRCVVQVAGSAARTTAGALRAAVAGDGRLAALLHRYAHAYLAQVAQTAACNALHAIGPRCARWLLMTDDRAGGAAAATPPGFLLTQEYLSYMLGVRREGVSRAAHGLQAAGLIRYARGRITVLDRPGLEAAACECYGIVRDEQARVGRSGPPGGR